MVCPKAAAVEKEMEKQSEAKLCPCAAPALAGALCPLNSSQPTRKGKLWDVSA